MIDQSSAIQEPQEAPKRIPPPEPFCERLAAVRAHRNPLLEAVRPLLRAQPDMPITRRSRDARGTGASRLASWN